MEPRALNLSTVLEKRGMDPNRLSPTEALVAWSNTRLAAGLNPNPAPLLTAPDGNPKFLKTTEAAIYGLSLAPAELSGVNVCAFSTEGCRRACLNLAGKGPLRRIQLVRVTRTKFLAAEPDAFATLLVKEIDVAVRKHADHLAVRLNTLSDLRWELIAPWLFEKFNQVRFFDYTKHPRRRPPDNYHLTYSVSERTTAKVMAHRARTMPVAVVFGVTRGHPLPDFYGGMPVIDGDKTDARWLNPAGTVVGLRAKGPAIKDESGFVRSVEVAACQSRHPSVQSAGLALLTANTQPNRTPEAA